MHFKAIPRQIPYCTMKDFFLFFKLIINKKLFEGKAIEKFEAHFAKIYNSKFSISAASCRSIFSLILDSLGLKKGDEVILPALNLSAFPKILEFKGIKPIFVDIDPKTLTIDATKIAENITPNTKAIVAVHLFGNACDMDEIVSIAHNHSLYIIEDCANAFTTRYKEKYLGEYGDVSCFSLGHSKDIPTFGGGIAVTNDEKLYTEMKRLFHKDFTSPSTKEMFKMLAHNLVYKIATSTLIFQIFVFPFIFLFGLRGKDFVGNFIEEKDIMIRGIKTKKFTNFQAAIGLIKFQKSQDMQTKRIQHATTLNSFISQNCKIRSLETFKNGNNAYWNYVIIADDRDTVFKKLISKGIDAKKIDAYNCNAYEIFKNNKNNCPVVDKISNKLLAIPIYHTLNDSDIQFIGNILANV